MIRDKSLMKTSNVCLLAMICCALWGSASPAIKIGYELFQIASSDTGSVILFAGYRFTLAGLITILISCLQNKKLMIPSMRAIPKVIVLSLIQTIMQYTFFYIGLAHTTGVKGSIIVGSNVFITIIVASLIFQLEKLSLRKIIGCTLGFLGVVLINLNGSGLDMEFHILGEGFVLLSTVAYAFSSVLMKLFSREENPVILSGYQFLFGGIVMIVVGVAMGGQITNVTKESIGILVYLAFAAATAYTIWSLLLKHNPASKVAVFGFMNPVFGVILSSIFLKESNQAFQWWGIVALVLVCVGIYVVNGGKRVKA